MAEAAKAWLLQANDTGVSVYGHLTEVLAHMLNTQPTDAVDALEITSHQVKQSYFTKDSAIPPPAPTAAPDADSATSWQQSNSALLKAKAGDEEEEEAKEDLRITNLLDDLALIEWAGIGLSAEEAYRVHLSIYKLQQSKKLATARFFGKILGTSADYYIVEAKYLEEPEKEEEEGEAAAPPVPPEERGTGCNTCVYFATNDSASPWVELPDVTPAQVAASRHIRKYFTGDLQAAVRAFPPFPGKEREYLRAQIARIAHDTVLCPKGKFVLEGEEDEPKTVVENESEEYTPLTGAEMSKPASWCNFHKGILDIGRCTNPPKDEEEEEEEGEGKPKSPEPEAEKEALAPIAAADWSLLVYPRMGGQAVTVARSIRWPGAHAAAVMREDKFCNLYMGYGHERLAGGFAPLPPPSIEQEPDDLVEEDDPPLAEENVAVLEEARKKLEEETGEEEED
uniref:Uncharacterized protein n=1 Tax=Chrysotila carterae TaxID=13221 RepID=A0A7S4EYZ4_CHRCT